VIKVSEILNITLPIPTSVNQAYKPRGYTSGGRTIMGIYKTAEAKQYQKYAIQTIKREIKQQEWIGNPLDKNLFVCIDAVVYFPRTDMDVNNIWKVLLDSVRDTQLIVPDDNKVLERAVRVFYDTENPRVELKIYYAPYVGIFESEEEYNEFKSSNCNQCSRQKRNCSIINKAIESRIVSEIDLISGLCLKFKLK
jgi:crossover junction endodeoxyribonuclease RusA